jgi:ribosome-associated translation inhibitor RaiA
MQTKLHFHHAVVSPRTQQRAEEGVARLMRRLGNEAVSATVRFEEDGPARRVEIELHASRGRRFVAAAQGRYFGPALAQALTRVAAQLGRVKRTPKTRARAMARA